MRKFDPSKNARENRITAVVGPEIKARVNVLRRAERRSESNMARILIEEALEARNG